METKLVVSARTIRHSSGMDDPVVTEWRNDSFKEGVVRINIDNDVELYVQLSELDKVVKMLSYDRELRQYDD